MPPSDVIHSFFLYFTDQVVLGVTYVYCMAIYATLLLLKVPGK